MDILSAYSISKEANFPEANEDCFTVSDSVITLCDGASQSFAAKIWARKVADHFCDAEVKICGESINKIIRDYIGCIDIASLSWTDAVSFENGSFATLLRLINGSEGIKVQSIGDCLCVYMDSFIVKTFPYSTPEDFERNPSTVSSRQEHNINVESKISTLSISTNQSRVSQKPSRGSKFGFTPRKHFNRARKKLRFRINKQRFERRKSSASFKNRSSLLRTKKLLIMTDALGQWLCSNKVANYRTLTEINSEQDFERLVIKLRVGGEIRMDDTTLLTIAI